MSFEEFKVLAEAHGLSVVDHTIYHWQIKGKGLTVNYYPTTSKVHVNGTKGARPINHPEEALQAALMPPPRQEDKVERPRVGYKKEKKRMLALNPRCHWCNKILNQLTATVDHRIPLARGGSDLPDNLVLACGECNRWRGHDMPELA